MAKTKLLLTWSRQPNDQGLARVCQGERGAILKLNGVKIGYLNTYSNDAALAVKKFLSAEGTRLSSSKAAGPRHGDAFAQGREAGHRVGLTPPKRALTGG